MEFHTGVFAQLLAWPFLALAYWVIGRSLPQRPSWPVRLFAAGGAAAASGGALFTAIICVAVHGRRGMDTRGPVLLAAICGVAVAGGVFLWVLLASAYGQIAARSIRVASWLGFAAGMVAAIYGGLFRW